MKQALKKYIEKTNTPVIDLSEVPRQEAQTSNRKVYNMDDVPIKKKTMTFEELLENELKQQSNPPEPEKKIERESIKQAKKPEAQTPKSRQEILSMEDS